ncbi:MAG: ABC transporter ATP-binding protein [Candidatus Methanomethylophilaceae archaeon]|nr:ABC transporter ATP-binding protein [Candidatus Methanomethylophilaceae archaeon]
MEEGSDRVAAVSLRSVRKTYGDVTAVDDVSFDVGTGEFFAFLGPNGAGKSTVISMITSMSQPDSGEVTVFGRNAADPEVRRCIGAVFQDPMLDGRLTVEENLGLRAEMYGMRKKEVGPAIDEAMASVGISELAGHRYGELSGGQRRSADLARALLHRPRLLILDEPTAGLDPVSRKRIWDTVRGLNAKGLTVLVTTHYMEEASEADDVVILDKGRIVAHGTPSLLKEAYSRDRLVMVPSDPESFGAFLSDAGIAFARQGDRFTVDLDGSLGALPVLDRVRDRLESFEVVAGTLDDVFVNITGRGLQ